MRIATSKSDLQSALQKLSKATPTRSTLPILSCVLFEVENDEVVLRTTDLEITIVVQLSASIEEVGSAAIPLQTLLDITNELPDGRLTLAVNPQHRVELISDTGIYDLMGKPAEEFPARPDIDGRKAINMTAESLKAVIDMTLFAVSRDDLKPALTGVYCNFGDENLTAVATDGHRLVRYIRKDYEPGEFSGKIIVPKKFLGLINTFLLSADTLSLWMSENHLTAGVGKNTIYTRVIDERFPDYESVIPDDNEKELVVAQDVLLGAVRRVSIFSNKSTHQIALHLSKEKSTITTEDPEKASRAEEELPAEFSGEDLAIGYNADYLKDIVSHVTHEQIRVKLNTPISAALFYPQEQEDNCDVTMLLMPIRLND